MRMIAIIYAFIQTFVYENNLYYQANAFTTPVRVADNKGSKYILNGISDWLYEGMIQ